MKIENLIKSVFVTLILTAAIETLANPGICDRNEFVQTAILKSLDSELHVQADCAAVRYSELALLKNLYVFKDNRPYAYKILPLAATDFDGLLGLEKLVLHSQSDPIVFMHSAPLAAMPNLKEFYLHSYASTKLNKDLFDGLSKLELIYFEYCAPFQFPSGVFQNIQSLESLTFGKGNGCYVRSPALKLDENTFTGSVNLKALKMGAGLSEIPDNIFRGLTKLETLDLRQNVLRTLPETLFDGLSSLHVVSIGGGNQISQAELDDFTLRLGPTVSFVE